MASEFESQHVDIPTAHVVPFTRAWKLREPELDSRLREWVDVVEIALTPCPQQDNAERQQLLGELIAIYFETTALMTGGRRRVTELQRRAHFLQENVELWSSALQRLNLRHLSWAVTKIQALYRSRKARRRCAALRAQTQAHANRLGHRAFSRTPSGSAKPTESDLPRASSGVSDTPHTRSHTSGSNKTEVGGVFIAPEKSDAWDGQPHEHAPHAGSAHAGNLEFLETLLHQGASTQRLLSAGTRVVDLSAPSEQDDDASGGPEKASAPIRYHCHTALAREFKKKRERRERPGPKPEKKLSGVAPEAWGFWNESIQRSMQLEGPRGEHARRLLESDSSSLDLAHPEPASDEKRDGKAHEPKKGARRQLRQRETARALGQHQPRPPPHGMCDTRAPFQDAVPQPRPLTGQPIRTRFIKDYASILRPPTQAAMAATGGTAPDNTAKSKWSAGEPTRVMLTDDSHGALKEIQDAALVPACASFTASAPPFASTMRARAVDRMTSSRGGAKANWDPPVQLMWRDVTESAAPNEESGDPGQKARIRRQEATPRQPAAGRMPHQRLPVTPFSPGVDSACQREQTVSSAHRVPRPPASSPPSIMPTPKPAAPVTPSAPAFARLPEALRDPQIWRWGPDVMSSTSRSQPSPFAITANSQTLRLVSSPAFRQRLRLKGEGGVKAAKPAFPTPVRGKTAPDFQTAAQ